MDKCAGSIIKLDKMTIICESLWADHRGSALHPKAIKRGNKHPWHDNIWYCRMGLSKTDF